MEGTTLGIPLPTPSISAEKVPTSVPVPAGRLAVREVGSGAPVVLVHGGTGIAAIDWAPLVQPLSSRYRVITFDLRGHGESANDGVPLGIVRFGMDLQHVLRHAGVPRAALIGFSVGGNSLLQLVARRPQLATALVTIGSAARGDADRVAKITSGPWPDELTSIVHAVGHGPEYWRDIRSMLARDWADNLALGEDALRRITCPTLICHGDRDRVQRLDEAIHLARHIPHAELFVAPRAGHAVQLDRPDLFVPVLTEFLGRVLGA